MHNETILASEREKIKTTAKKILFFLWSGWPAPFTTSYMLGRGDENRLNNWTINVSSPKKKKKIEEKKKETMQLQAIRVQWK